MISPSPPPPRVAYRQIVNGNENLCNSHPTSERLTKLREWERERDTGERCSLALPAVAEVNVRTNEANEYLIIFLLNECPNKSRNGATAQATTINGFFFLPLPLLLLLYVMKMAHMAMPLAGATQRFRLCCCCCRRCCGPTRHEQATETERQVDWQFYEQMCGKINGQR